MKRYECWYGDEYLGIFYEDEVRMMYEAGECFTAHILDD